MIFSQKSKTGFCKSAVLDCVSESSTFWYLRWLKKMHKCSKFSQQNFWEWVQNVKAEGTTPQKRDQALGETFILDIFVQNKGFELTNESQPCSKPPCWNNFNI